MSGAFGQTAGTRRQGKDVAGTGQIPRLGGEGNGGLDGGDAVGGGNAGGNPVFRLDRHREGGTEGRGILRHHRQQVEFTAARLGQHQTDDAGSLANQTRHLRHRQGGGGKDHVAFVFTVGVVNDDNAAAPLQGGDRRPLPRGGGGLVEKFIGSVEYGQMIHGLTCSKGGEPESGRATVRRSQEAVRVRGRTDAGVSRAPVRLPVLFHPDCTVGPGLSPGLLTPPLLRRALAGSPPFGRNTAGGELHPALRTSISKVAPSPGPPRLSRRTRPPVKPQPLDEPERACDSLDRVRLFRDRRALPDVRPTARSDA